MAALPLSACTSSNGGPTSDEDRRRAGSSLVEGLLSDEPSVLEYHEVDELGPAQRGKTLRVHGWVKPGSIAQRKAPAGLRFVVVRGRAELTVEYAGTMPDRFQERLETIVTGTLSDDGRTLRGDSLVAKCPDNYDELPSWPEDGAPR